MHAVEGGLFIAIFGRKILGSDAGEQLDIEFPSGGTVGVARSELPFQESKLDFEAGQAPLLQKVASFHSNTNVGNSPESKSSLAQKIVNKDASCQAACAKSRGAVAPLPFELVAPVRKAAASHRTPNKRYNSRIQILRKRTGSP